MITNLKLQFNKLVHLNSMSSISNHHQQLQSAYPKIFQQMKLRQKEYISLIKDLHQENKTLRNTLNDQSRNSTTTNWRNMQLSNHSNCQNIQIASNIKDTQHQFSNRTFSNYGKQNVLQSQKGKMLVKDTIKQVKNERNHCIILGSHHRHHSPKNYAQLQRNIGNSLYKKIIKQAPLVYQQQAETKRIMSNSSSNRIIYNTNPNSPRVIDSHRAMGSPAGSPRGLGSPRIMAAPKMIPSPRLASQNNTVQPIIQNTRQNIPQNIPQSLSQNIPKNLSQNIPQNKNIRTNQYPPKVSTNRPPNTQNIITPTSSELFAYLQQQMKNTKNAAICLEKHLSSLQKKQVSTKETENYSNQKCYVNVNNTKIQSLTKISQKDIKQQNHQILCEKNMNSTHEKIKDDNSQVRIVSDKQFLQIQENIQESQVYNIQPKIIKTQNHQEKQNLYTQENQNQEKEKLSKNIISNNKNKSVYAVQFEKRKNFFQNDKRITFEDLQAGREQGILMDIDYGNLAGTDNEKLSSSPLYRIQYGNGLAKQSQSKSPHHSPKGSLHGTTRKKAQRINNQIYL